MLVYIIIILCLIAFFANGVSDNLIVRLVSLMFITIVLVAGWVLFESVNNQPIIIQKSSDSEWELSTNYNIKSDTCITTVKIVNQTDTVYPTTCYKVLKSINK